VCVCVCVVLLALTHSIMCVCVCVCVCACVSACCVCACVCVCVCVGGRVCGCMWVYVAWECRCSYHWRRNFGRPCPAYLASIPTTQHTSPSHSTHTHLIPTTHTHTSVCVNILYPVYTCTSCMYVYVSCMCLYVKRTVCSTFAYCVSCVCVCVCVCVVQVDTHRAALAPKLEGVNLFFDTLFLNLLFYTRRLARAATLVGLQVR
jgi:hypothetical protein